MWICQNFFVARSFRNRNDLNLQPRTWFDTIANVRQHRTTQRVVSEAFAAEKPDLQLLPAVPFNVLLKLERRISHDVLFSVGGNYYSVPDRTRQVVEVHQLPDTIRILDGSRLVARHAILDGRRRYHVDHEHRQGATAQAVRHGHPDSLPIGPRGDHVAQRSLPVYQAVSERLAAGIGSRL